MNRTNTYWHTFILFFLFPFLFIHPMCPAKEDQIYLSHIPLCSQSCLMLSNLLSETFSVLLLGSRRRDFGYSSSLTYRIPPWRASSFGGQPVFWITLDEMQALGAWESKVIPILKRPVLRDWRIFSVRARDLLQAVCKVEKSWLFLSNWTSYSTEISNRNIPHAFRGSINIRSSNPSESGKPGIYAWWGVRSTVRSNYTARIVSTTETSLRRSELSNQLT